MKSWIITPPIVAKPKRKGLANMTINAASARRM